MSRWKVNFFLFKSKNKFIYDRQDKDQSNLRIFIDTQTDMNFKIHYRKLTEHELHFKSYASNSHGIVVLRKSSCLVSNFNKKNIIPRDLTKISFTFNDKKYVIFALYGPRKDNVEFFKKNQMNSQTILTS